MSKHSQKPTRLKTSDIISYKHVTATYNSNAYIYHATFNAAVTQRMMCIVSKQVLLKDVWSSELDAGKHIHMLQLALHQKLPRDTQANSLTDCQMIFGVQFEAARKIPPTGQVW